MFRLTIVTPEKSILMDQPMSEILIGGHFGELNILPGHAPLMTPIRASVLRYKLEGESEYTRLAVSAGYLEVDSQGVNVLAETAESKKEIDVDRAKKSLESAQKILDDENFKEDQFLKYQAKVKRAETRLSV